MKPLLIVLSAVTFVTLATAQPDEGKTRAAAIAPWVDDQAHSVVCFNLDQLGKDSIGRYFGLAEKMNLLDSKERATAEKVAGILFEKWEKTKAKNLYVVGRLPNMEATLLVVPLVKDIDKNALLDLLKQIPGLQTEERGNFVIAGNAAMLKQAQSGKHDVPELAKGFAAVAGDFIQVVVRPPPLLRRALAETMTVLPKELGGGPWSVADEGVQWIAVGANLSPKPAVRVIVQSKNAGAAKALFPVINKSLALLSADKEVRFIFPDVEKLVPLFTPKVMGDQLILKLEEETFLRVATAVGARFKAEAEHAQAINNMKQIGLAMHSFHDGNKSFPATASYDAKGKPLLSWRVHVLPYLDEEKLYKEFKLDEPWDSAHNKKLIARMPAVYKVNGQKNAGDGKTCYQVPFGKGFAFEGPKGLTFRDFSDGTSNTIMLLETDDAHAVLWTKPDDWQYHEKEPLRGLGRPKSSTFNALFADGSVRRLPRTIATQTFYALLTRAGGEPIGPLD